MKPRAFLILPLFLSACGFGRYERIPAGKGRIVVHLQDVPHHGRETVTAVLSRVPRTGGSGEKREVVVALPGNVELWNLGEAKYYLWLESLPEFHRVFPREHEISLKLREHRRVPFSFQEAAGIDFRSRALGEGGWSGAIVLPEKEEGFFQELPPKHPPCLVPVEARVVLIYCGPSLSQWLRSHSDPFARVFSLFSLFGGGRETEPIFVATVGPLSPRQTVSLYATPRPEIENERVLLSGRVLSTKGEAMPWSVLLAIPTTGVGSGLYVRTDSRGGYEIRGLVPGDYSIVATDSFSALFGGQIGTAATFRITVPATPETRDLTVP